MRFASRAFLFLLKQRVAKRLEELPKKGKEAWDELWGNNPNWTEFMVGSRKTRTQGEDFGVLGDIGKSLGLGFQAEYLRVDQIWYSGQDEEKSGWIIEAYLEHENYPGKLKDTILKMLSLGTGFKAVITYTDDEKRKKELLAEASKAICNRFGTIPSERILVIFGSWDGDEIQDLRWEAHDFDGQGRMSTITVDAVPDG